MSGNDYRNKFDKNSYYKIVLRMPKEKKAVMQELSEIKHKSINQLVIDAIEKQYHVDLTFVESKLKE